MGLMGHREQKVASPMLFNFRLRAVSDIVAWGGERPTLHWFGLSDGWYWLTVAGGELFRFSRELMQREEPWRSDPAVPPYVDYYVVRLWEDLLDQLPEMLTPLPPALADRVSDAAAWRAWQDDAERWRDRHDNDAAIDLWEKARWWWDTRRLDTGYLRHGPWIWCWRVGDTVYLRWDDRPLVSEGCPVWAAQSGEQVLPVGVFLDEVRDFDTRFMAAMAARVNAACENWPRPDVAIDLDQLASEQRERAGWLARSLARLAQRAPEDWDAILDAIARIERGDAP